MKKTTYIAIFACFLPLLGFAQGEVAFPDGTVFWRAYDTVAGSYHYGYTMPDQVTTTGQPNFDTLRNEMEWLALIAEMPVEFDTLPAIGDTILAREVYRYGDALIMARQSHRRTIFPPEETPALFGFYRPEAPDTHLDWIANEDVFVNTIRRYDGVLYVCIQAHFTLSNFMPPATPALWRVFQEPGGCAPWVQPTGAQDAYNIDDCVTYEGQEWISTVNANVWAPGVFGWILKP
jgi:hypothetical protein